MSVVLVETVRPGVAVIRLNRPEFRNALTTEVRRLIEKHVNEIAEDDSIKVIVLTGGFAVTMRNNMINLLGEDYIVMGRAKGLADNRVMLFYAARNALLPTVSSLAIAMGTVLGGSLIVEVVFNYPGLGNTLYQAILARDYPVIQGQLLIMTGAMLVSNFVVDLSYVLLDPRLKKA